MDAVGDQIRAGSSRNIQYPISNIHNNLPKPITETSIVPARAIVIAAFVLAMQILAGYQTMALFTLEAVTIWY